MRNAKLSKATLQNLILLNTIMLKLLQRLERVLGESKKANLEWDGIP